MAVYPKGVNIGTISGGIVNFGGAVCISPITATQTSPGSSGTTGSAGTSTGSSGGGGGASAPCGSTNTGGTICGLSAQDKKMISNIIDFLGTML